MSKQSIKATIDTNIKQNGVQAITGQIMNSVLNQMVDNLAEEASTTEKLTELESEVIEDSIKNGISLVGEYVDGYYISISTHEPIAYAKYGYIKYANPNIKKIRVSGVGLDYSGDSLIFYKDTTIADGNYIESYLLRGATNEVINVPLGTKLICLSACYKQGETLRISDVEFWDEADLGNIFQHELIGGYYLNRIGNLVSSKKGALRKFLVPELSAIRLVGTAVGGSTLSIAFYSSYETINSTTLLKGYTYTGAVNQVIDVPKHTVCIILSEWAKVEKLSICNADYPIYTSDLRKILTNELVNGYYLNNSDGVPTSNAKARYRKFYSPNIKSVRLKGTAIGGSTLSIAFYSDYDIISNTTYISGVTYEGVVDAIVNVPKNAKCIAIGEWVTESLTIMDAEYNTGNSIKLYSCINKPFDFGNNTKKAVFFGDSITYGATSGSGGLHNTEGWPILICNQLGLIYTPRTDINPSNQAVSGSLYTTNPNVSEQTIASRIMATSFPADVFFIAGGCNDYNCNAEIGDLDSTEADKVCGALNNICDYLHAEYPNAEVFFITPINQAVPRKNPQYGSGNYTQDEFRDAIFKVVTKWGYNVIDGSQIGFPEENGAYKDLMLYDGLHPTELGYELYAKTLAGIIL